MSILGLSLTLIEFALFGVLAVAFIYQSFFYMHYIMAVLINNRRNEKNKNHFTKNYLPVSVIICVKNEDENLLKNLPLILKQEYPARFEVIVVNEGATNETDIIISKLKRKYKNLKSTFVPNGIKLIVPRKLAVTLGVKAALNEWIVFTNADCMPKDKFWLKRIARNFLPETDFVFAHSVMFKTKGLLNKMITYDSLFRQLKLFGYALHKKPITSMINNFALRKSVFINNKGFKKILTLPKGDLELIANRYSAKNNTRVETASGSTVWSNAQESFSEWFYSRENEFFINRQLRFSSILRLSVEMFFRIVFYLSFIACLLLGNFFTITAAVFLFLIRFFIQYITINQNSQRFDGQRYYISVLLFDILLPLIDLYIFIFGKKLKKIF